MHVNNFRIDVNGSLLLKINISQTLFLRIEVQITTPLYCREVFTIPEVNNDSKFSRNLNVEVRGQFEVNSRNFSASKTYRYTV